MSYKIAFTPQASSDLEYWKHTSPKTVEKIKKMLLEMQEHPFIGTGKPEALKYQFAGAWSRRINHKDRLVYQVNGEIVTVLFFSYLCPRKGVLPQAAEIIPEELDPDNAGARSADFPLYNIV